MTLEELKARNWDIVCQLEALQQELRRNNQQMMDLSKNGTKTAVTGGA